ncbi:MAG: GNAT family N-acetyltransferase [Nitrososphaerales archaeon]
MDTSPAINEDLPRDLGNGLLLRRSTRADAEPLAEFNRWVHRDPGIVEPDDSVAAWTRDLLSGRHPTFGEGDFSLIVEKDTGRIVSALNLISQTWSYAGIPFGVGRIELVGTAPEYRGRGLIRTQFDVVHKWSAARGEMVQSITGIPYYYRQFGYEMALDLDGRRMCYKAAVPALKEGQAEAFVLRRVTKADLPFVMSLDADASRRSLISMVRDERLWHYELFERSPRNTWLVEWRIVQSADGSAMGLVGYIGNPWDANRLAIMALELAPGWSYVESAASILRGLKAEGEAVFAARGKPFEILSFHLGESHPFYEANHDRLGLIRPAYAWYIRVPDLVGFLRHVAPAFEERLARSWAAGHTGVLKLSFYRRGVKLALARGRFTAIEPWLPVPHDDEGDAGFPGLTFLQMLFGYRDFAGLRAAFPDCWAGGDETRGLLNALFPRQPSDFLALA